MKSSLYLVLSLSALILFSACRKTANSPQFQSGLQDDALTNATGTVIYKFGFETNSYDTSFKGWTGYHSFSKSVPPNGGAWSLELHPVYIPGGGNAEHIIKADTGSYRLRFSCYTNIESNTAHNGGIGYLRLIKQTISTTSNNAKRETLAETTFTNHVWKVNNVTADVNIKPGDVIIIQVSAGFAELITWTTLFDNVKVEKL